MKTLLLLFTTLSLFFASCKKSDDLAALSGTWQEVHQQPSFAGSTYRITFYEGGSFRLAKSLFNDAIDLSKPCSDNRTQYVRGNYGISGNVLSLSGKFSDSTYATDVPDCAMGADFTEQYNVGGSGDRLILDADQGYGEKLLDRQ